MTTGLGGVTCLLGDACRRGVSSSAFARLFVQVGSSTSCCDDHVSVGFRLWNWCVPAKTVVVGLVNIGHSCQCQVGSTSRHANQVTVKCVSGA